MPTTELDRAAVLAHRAHAQGLSGTAPDPLAVLRLGLQDTPGGSAALGLRARDPDGAPDADHLVTVLSARGSPHLHRRDDLPVLRAALPPVDGDELLGLLGERGAPLVEAGADPGALLDDIAGALRATFPGEGATKGELSAAVTAHAPPIASYWCAVCAATHLQEGLFRLGTLLAGIEVVADGGARLRFAMPPGEPARVTGRAGLFDEYVRLAGPVAPADLGGWLDVRAVTGRPRWPAGVWDAHAGDVTEARVAGRDLWMAAADVDGVADAPPPPPLRLLPPRDALLLGHRPLLVPDRAEAKQVWRTIHSPGVLLLDGDVAGVWRHRGRGRRVQVEVEPFAPLLADRRRALVDEAQAVVEIRGGAEAELTVLGD